MNFSKYIVEIATWEDHGDTEYHEADTLEEARKILDREIAAVKKWAIEETGDDDGYPGIAKIRVRPDADEDGDYPEIYDWDVV